MSWPLRVIRWSYIALFTLVPIIFLPWTSELFEFNKIILTYALTTIIVGAWAIRCILEGRRIFTPTPLDLPLLIFLISQSLSLLFSIDMRTSVFGYYGRWNGGLLSLASYALLYWALVSNLDKKFLPRLIGWLLVGSSAVAVYGIAQHYGIDAKIWVQDVQNRVFSTLGQPNWLAAYIVALIFIPLSHLARPQVNPRTPAQTFHLLVFILLFITLLFTKSRSGFLAFGISSLIFWTPQFIQHKSKIINHFLIFSLLTLALTLTISNPLRDLVFKSTRSAAPSPAGPALETGGTESGTIRKIVWTGALRIWQGSPKNFLIGTGPETFAMAYYQYRPIEHNNTSEWELLYNKAHNEFLNVLATTGLVGQLAYLYLLFAMARQLFASGRSDLLAGWASLPVTNFWGFSVVPVQLLLFLLPAISATESAVQVPADRARSGSAERSDGRHTSDTGGRSTLADAGTEPLSKVQLLSLLVCTFSFLALIFNLAKYWLADFRFSASQKDLQAFSQTEDPSFLITAYQSASQAHDLNPFEPSILTQLAESSAYLAIFSADVDASSSAQLAELADTAASQAITLSPAHPNHLKAASRVFILLSALDPKYLDLADSVLAAAQNLSPTDPRLPYQRAVIAKYQNHPDQAADFIAAALRLKPDFADAQAQLIEIASSSAKIGR